MECNDKASPKRSPDAENDQKGSGKSGGGQGRKDNVGIGGHRLWQVYHREGSWSFLTSCRLYISLSINDFTDKQAQIHWALSYFKSGRTATFTDHTLRAEAKRGGLSYATWADFEAEFRSTFFLANEATTSLMRLESEHYF
jgi:hypothetical protein